MCLPFYSRLSAGLRVICFLQNRLSTHKNVSDVENALKAVRHTPSIFKTAKRRFSTKTASAAIAATKCAL